MKKKNIFHIITSQNPDIEKIKAKNIVSKKSGIAVQSVFCFVLIISAVISGVIAEKTESPISALKIIDDAVSALNKMDVDTTELKSAYDSCDTDQITSRMDEIITLLSEKGYDVTELKTAYDSEDYDKVAKLMDEIIITLKDEGYDTTDITDLLGTCNQEKITTTENHVVEYLDGKGVDSSSLKEAYEAKDKDKIKSLLKSYTDLFPHP